MATAAHDKSGGPGALLSDEVQLPGMTACGCRGPRHKKRGGARKKTSSVKLLLISGRARGRDPAAVAVRSRI